MTNGIAKEPIPDIDPYRGMPISFGGDSYYASARDIGNIAAGYIGGINGLGWLLLRLGADGYQSIMTSRKKNALTIDFEGHSTTSAQMIGWKKGFSEWLKETNTKKK